MKLGFICLDLPGHLNLMSALALELQARNHEVVFLYSSGPAGLPSIRGPDKDHINENRPEASKRHGQDALQFSIGPVLAQEANGLSVAADLIEESLGARKEVRVAAA